MFIIDEAHRTTFGDMLLTIKHTFPNAIFFGFTGTPIEEENAKKNSTTATVFGNELHRYSIADAFVMKMCWAFIPSISAPLKTAIYAELSLCKKPKQQMKAKYLPMTKRKKIYNQFMNNVPMAGEYTSDGKYQKGIEDYIQ